MIENKVEFNQLADQGDKIIEDIKNSLAKLFEIKEVLKTKTVQKDPSVVMDVLRLEETLSNLKYMLMDRMCDIMDCENNKEGICSINECKNECNNCPYTV